MRVMIRMRSVTSGRGLHRHTIIYLHLANNKHFIYHSNIYSHKRFCGMLAFLSSVFPFILILFMLIKILLRCFFLSTLSSSLLRSHNRLCAIFTQTTVLKFQSRFLSILSVRISQILVSVTADLSAKHYITTTLKLVLPGIRSICDSYF